mmetsp:Transcript_35973/g.69883  ORF Transcript_35973/g.69883 Transcript_35973/m.69883 type:complete len:507 (-) Transcript_35973:10-1530(-)
MEQFAALESALLARGAVFSKVRIAGRKLITTSELKEGEVLISIPLSCCITSDMGRDTPWGAALSERTDTLGDEFRDQVYLAVYYLQFRDKKECFHHPYFKVFPKNRDDFPVFWSASQIEALHGSSIQASIEGLQECLKREYAMLSRCEGFRGITLDDFKWARMLISSRAFRLTVRGREIRMLGPFADLMDHAEKRRTTWTYDEEIDALTVRALEDFRAGEEIRCHYGKKSAKKFLLYYGFTPDETLTGEYRHLNDVEFVMFVHPDFPEAKAKQRLLNEEYSCKKYSVDVAFTQGNTLEALSFMRLLCAKGEEEMAALPAMSEAYTFRDHPLHPISVRNEIEVLRMLSNMMREQQSHYSREMKRLRLDAAGDRGGPAPAAGAESGGSRKRKPTKSTHSAEGSSSGRKRARMEGLKPSSSSPSSSAQRSAETVVLGEMMVCRFFVDLAEAVIPALERMGDSLTMKSEGLSRHEKEYLAYVCYSLQVRRKAKMDSEIESTSATTASGDS